MGWAGFIVAVLGTIGTIVGTCVTIAGFRRDRREHSQHAMSNEHADQAQGSRSRWVWPNILALDVIVLAVLAAGIFLITQSHGAPGRPSGQGTTSSSSTKPTSLSPSAGQVSTPSSSAWSKQWGPHSLSFTDNVSVDLDSVPPDVTGDSTPATLDLYGSQLVGNPGTDIATWTGNGAATAAACATLISTHGVQAITPVAGKTYCSSTAKGNIAILTVQQISVDNSGNMTTASVTATIWSNGPPASPPSSAWSKLVI
jgi:hypothetical protein